MGFRSHEQLPARFQIASITGHPAPLPATRNPATPGTMRKDAVGESPRSRRSTVGWSLAEIAAGLIVGTLILVS